MPPLTIQSRWWQWPTVLSFDAPVVCLLWQALGARVAAVDLRAPHALVLGLSVWLAYVADRWVEGWRLDLRDVRTPRHRFYQQRRWPMAAVWISALGLDVGVALASFTGAELLRGVALLAAVLLYLLSHQLVHRTSSWRAPKEIVIAVLLTAGVALFLVPTPRVADLSCVLGLFAMLSFLNCALISTWEHEVDTAHGQTSIALDVPRAIVAIRVMPWALSAGAAIGATLAPAPMRAVCAVGAASALLLGVVDRLEAKTGWRVAHVLADAALMAPVVPLLWSGWT